GSAPEHNGPTDPQAERPGADFKACMVTRSRAPTSSRTCRASSDKARTWSFRWRGRPTSELPLQQKTPTGSRSSGVDSDGCRSVPQMCPLFWSSAHAADVGSELRAEIAKVRESFIDRRISIQSRSKPAG